MITLNTLKKRPPTLLLAVACALALSGCATQERLTDVPPYATIVGQRYILNEVCYGYYNKDKPKDVQLGAPQNVTIQIALWWGYLNNDPLAFHFLGFSIFGSKRGPEGISA